MNTDPSIPTPEERHHLSVRVGYLRRCAMLSARELSERLDGGMSRAVIANIESGRKTDMTVTELIALCRALDASATDIFPSLATVLPGAEDDAELRRRLADIAELARL